MTLTADEVVARLFDTMQARDWAGARACVAPDAVVVYPVSGERFRGDGWMAMNEAYPEGWEIEVVELVADGDRAAARVAVRQDGTTFWCAGWYRTEGGRIVEATEIWATGDSESPPEWRRPYWAPAD